jgi:selenocysteine-specific elongation factor
MRLQAHHGTRESAARVYPLGDGYAQLRLESSIVAERGDHVILRRLEPADTIGGAVVVEAPARRHGPRAEVVERLRILEAGGDPEARVAAKARVGADASPGSADTSSPDAEPAIRAPLDAAALAIGDLLRADRERPRTDSELAAAAGVDADTAAGAFRALELHDAAVRVARNLHFDAAALDALVARVVAICERDGSATIASVRDELDTSRKYAQAILEHMDATKVTLRRDDEHVLRRRQ